MPLGRPGGKRFETMGGHKGRVIKYREAEYKSRKTAVGVKIIGL
jgi:hypothetical protein